MWGVATPSLLKRQNTKWISRCPPELVSMSANTRLFSLSSRTLDLDASGLKNCGPPFFFNPSLILFCLSVECGGLVKRDLEFENTFVLFNSSWSEELIVTHPTLFNYFNGSRSVLVAEYFGLTNRFCPPISVQFLNIDGSNVNIEHCIICSILTFNL